MKLMAIKEAHNFFHLYGSQLAKVFDTLMALLTH